jgi:predicted permease
VKGLAFLLCVLILGAIVGVLYLVGWLEGQQTARINAQAALVHAQTTNLLAHQVVRDSRAKSASLSLVLAGIFGTVGAGAVIVWMAARDRAERVQRQQAAMIAELRRELGVSPRYVNVELKPRELVYREVKH